MENIAECWAKPPLESFLASTPARLYGKAMLSPTQFQTESGHCLSALYDALDTAYEAGTLEELELEPGLLTIVTASGKSFIVSAHAPSSQMWLASPLSGGLHFHYQDGAWNLPDGRNLQQLLLQELATQGVECAA